MKKYSERGGFTLIELLVVIAIIGILSSIILVSLNSARTKGKDARVISDVQQLRTQIETDAVNPYYDVSFAAACTVATDAACGIVATGNYSTLSTDLTTYSGTLTVWTTRVAGPHITAYALWGKLPSQTTATYFCVDSTGNAKQSTQATPAITCS